MSGNPDYDKPQSQPRLLLSVDQLEAHGYDQPYDQQQYGQPYSQNSTNNTAIVMQPEKYSSRKASKSSKKKKKRRRLQTTQPDDWFIEPDDKPQDYLALAIVLCLFCGGLFGFVAIIFSCKSKDSADAGNYEDARSNGKISLCLSMTNIFVAIVVGITLYAVHTYREY